MTDNPTLHQRYEQAAALAPEKQAALMRNRRIDPVWTGDGDVFWYVRQTDDGEEHVLVDPVAGTRTVAATLEELGVDVSVPTPSAGLLVGPDGRGLTRRDHDLWLIDADGTETQVTKDGEPGFAWGELPEASNMAVPFRRMGLVLPPIGTVHSPSGRLVLTMRTDQRGMQPAHLVEHVSTQGRPECHEIRVRLDDEGDNPPGGARILDLDAGTSVDIDVTDGLTSMVIMNGSCEATWSADETRVFFFHRQIGGATASLVEVDAATGARRDVITLDEAPLYEPNQFLYSLPLVRVLPETDEAILFSQRDGWGHLYLYDLVTGDCKNAVSSGEMTVRDIVHVDVEAREVTYLAGGGPEGNPLHRKVFRAGFDGGTQQLLTPEPLDHDLVAPEPQFFHLVFGRGKPLVTSVSPSGRFFVDHQSTVSDAPVIVLRDASAGGTVVLELERTDISRLLAAGYSVPRAFSVKADDGVTDLWGVLALPADPIDPASIPVIEYVYAGFQVTQAPPSFLGGGKTSGAHGHIAPFNALGFAGVLVDGRGTPGRDRAFRQHTFKQFHTARGLEDHVTFITGLASMEPSLDLSRVGVIGHSYGGYNAARMVLMFPDFFKAAVSGAGVHDPRKTPRGLWDWHMGTSYDRACEEYQQLGNLHLASSLVGDLLIACGEIDENATVDHSYALAQALIKAGKRFDFKVWPGLNHYQQGPYVQMAFWDHFVRSLHRLDLPRDFVPH
ncbi:MAG: prolyl oligopeptidase family serine peptidase [Actinomycetota bacterium]|nr:prolyl oligopeptidase family serine peptidase [Actinomycetota bacterium]